MLLNAKKLQSLAGNPAIETINCIGPIDFDCTAGRAVLLSRPMTDTIRKIAADPLVVSTILQKRDALLAERRDVRAKQVSLAARDREIDRELADCQAAGRVFGVDVEIPRDAVVMDGTQRGTVILSRAAYEKATGIIAATNALIGQTAPTAAEKAVTTKAEMPRVSDIVLDQLRKAGTAGSKAAPIQKYIESTYGTTIHDKTVGMTLYRLSQEDPPKVRRQGHTWFFVPEAETKNPGVGAPGQKDIFE